MVFFTCNHCGSSLKKNRVEKHYAVECRKPPAVSCMDCCKDFYGQEYTSHNKCISEEQKYSGQPANSNLLLGKGERKQMEWVETVRQIVESKGSSLTPQERKLLESLIDFENIPRKKNKFENFLKNAMGRYIDPRTIEKVWSLLEEHKSEVANNKEKSDAKESLPVSTNETEGGQPKPKKKKGTASREAEEIGGLDENPQKDTAQKLSKKEQSISRETEELGGADENETIPKLSKKEKREKKKKHKYELELESISKENHVLENGENLGEGDMELDQVETQVEGKVVKSKKKKKDKVKEEADAEENVYSGMVNDLKSEKKKKGKRKHNGDADKDGRDKKRIKGGFGEPEDQIIGDVGATESGVNGVTTEDVKGKGKFKWDKTIVSILKTVPDNELPLKRLRKKVLSAYQEALGERRCQELSLEEAMGTFERKLHKIPGVKVHKDKAKLVKTS